MMTLKLNGFCGCIGCWRKVNAALSSIKGIERKLIDKKKFLVTITGTVDTEALRAKLAKIRKGVKVEVIFQGDGEKKEEEKKPKEEANTGQKEENPKEKPDTNQKMEEEEKPEEEANTGQKEENPKEKPDTNQKMEEEEQKENADKAEAKSEKTSPSTSNDADASPSIRRRNSTEPMGEQNLENEPARFPCGYGFDYGPHAPFGDGPHDYPQGHAHGNDPPPQDHDHDNGPNNDPAPQDHAHGNGPYNDPPPQYFAGEISNACSIM
ncbi:hypothetical protein SADUNF_Sadunf16G0199900 [Salix dunnii]|uniref:HMA domain-containing protein n=1 Tax=Salix dunnii TaxID=1413687 RepID=A0A835JFB0_9ROSI|nr:hypothetical protein SADUNF_Sadunf16G0199900 [Salix dunnii]